MTFLLRIPPLLLLVATVRVGASSTVAWGGTEQRRRLQQHAFRRNVVRLVEERTKRNMERQQNNHPIKPSFVRGGGGAPSMDSLLIEKAVPLDEFNAKIVAAGGKPVAATNNDGLPEFMQIPAGKKRHRRLDEEGDEDAAADDDDSYYLDADSMYDFNAYSLKFTTCQKVQRFSTSAIANGEYSALVSNDIVILRLCPQRLCSDSSEYGCIVGYGDYAINLDDYLRIRMQHETDKQRNLCGFCQACSGGYADQYSGYSNNNNNNRRRRLAEDDDYYNAAAAGDDGNGDDAATDDASAADENAEDDVCSTYADLCEDYGDWCVFDEDEDEVDEDGYLSYDSYKHYFGCVEVDDDSFVSPRCDPYSSQISMALFYDPYCSQYAGNDYNVNELAGVNFQSDIFEDFHSGECIECQSSAYPPYYNANNNMCNKIYQKSGKCNTYLAYDFGEYDNRDAQDTTCAFVESIHDGRYDKTGMMNWQGGYKDAKVTVGQKVGLALVGALCCGLALYSCYLHHEITNVLLKSLANGALINSSRREESSNQRRSSRSRGRSDRKSSRNGRDDDSEDWAYT